MICFAYYVAYLPLLLGLAFTAGKQMVIPDVVQFFMLWIHHASAAVNGFLYIVLHSSVRRELRRYLPRCRRNTVAPAAIQPIGEGGRQRQCDIINADAEVPATAIRLVSRKFKPASQPQFY